MKLEPLTSPFHRFASWVSALSGHPITFMSAITLSIIWLITGPMVDYSPNWQWVLSTITGIIPFIMVFVLQNSQNRDTVAIQIKLNEIIRSLHGAHNVLLDLENLTSEELDQIRTRYHKLADEARLLIKQGADDTHAPQVCLKEE